MSTRRFDDLVTTVAKLRRELHDVKTKALRRAGRLPLLSDEDPPQPVSDDNDEEWVTGD